MKYSLFVGQLLRDNKFTHAASGGLNILNIEGSGGNLSIERLVAPCRIVTNKPVLQTLVEFKSVRRQIEVNILIFYSSS